MIMLGICSYNLVALRASDSDKSEMVSQLLFGDVYKVLDQSENGKWLQIEVEEDNYTGWLDAKLHTPIEYLFLEEYRRKTNHFCAEVVGYIEVGKAKQPIFFGSFLPLFDGDYVYLGKERFPFIGKADKIERKMSAEGILHIAESYFATPYLWGGKSHAGIDCSGLVQMVFRSSGHKLKRDAWQQASMGALVEKLDEARSGDLAFFSNDAGRVTHVGILIDSQTIIHAHGKVRIDNINDIGIINGDTGLYSHKLSGIRRILGQT